MPTIGIVWITILVTLGSCGVLWVFEQRAIPTRRHVPCVIWWYRVAGLWLITWFTVTSLNAGQNTTDLRDQVIRTQMATESNQDRIAALEAVRAGEQLAVHRQQLAMLEAGYEALSTKAWGILGALMLMIGGQIVQIRLTARAARQSGSDNDRDHDHDRRRPLDVIVR